MARSRDFLQDLGPLGVTARIKRLSDALTASIKELYRAQGLDLEPSWHLVLLLLAERAATPTEIAAALHLSQPATTQMLRRLDARGYLRFDPNEDDARSKRVRLSPLARRRLPRFERVWAAGRAAVTELVEREAGFLRGLGRLESRLEERGFRARVEEHLDEG